MIDIPLIRPSVPSLRRLLPELSELERSGTFSNFGPVNTRFEHELTALIEGLDTPSPYLEEGIGSSCVTVCNATVGLMLAIRAVVERRPGSGRRYALMPAFTFAAAAHAAQWCGLTPLLCDIDPLTWEASPQAEAELIARYGDEIAVIVPYATFGRCTDLDRYVRLSREHGIPVVVDAAASLGTRDAAGRPFGAGAPFPIVYSMHATKTFGIGEGGVIYCADRALIQTLRQMTNFGFGDTRQAEMAGLNAKLSELAALLALAKLDELRGAQTWQAPLVDAYREHLPGWQFQEGLSPRQALQFMPVALPRGLGPTRNRLVELLDHEGIGAAAYFSPHLGQQPYFRRLSVCGDLKVSNDLSSRIVSLPLWKDMTPKTVSVICRTLLLLTGEAQPAIWDGWGAIVEPRRQAAGTAAHIRMPNLP